MTRRSEILGDIVMTLRKKRSEGARVSVMVTELLDQGLDMFEIVDHFCMAFCLSDLFSMRMLAQDSHGNLRAEILDSFAEPKIDAARETWIKAPQFPDLLRRRDRHAFRQLAQETGNIFIVQAAEPEATQYVGQTGFKPWPLHLLGIARVQGPNPGLVAADPGSHDLQATLAALRPALTYQDYIGYLAAKGLSVTDESEGFVIRGQNGVRFYPGYQILGVYRETSGLSAWTGANGERLRWILNRRMGEDLVQFGPHDDWDGRLALDTNNPLRGPLAPALFFTPDGNVTVRFDAESIERYYRFLRIDWDALHPNKTISPPDREVI